MKKADYQMVGYILTVIGACLLAAAIFTFLYGEPHIDYMGHVHDYNDYPYRSSFMPLLIVGLVLLAVGLGVIWRVKQIGAKA